eukprot:3825622-Prymnesium_polylepis.1
MCGTLGTSSRRPASHILNDTRAEERAAEKGAVGQPGWREEGVAARTASDQAETWATAKEAGVTARA